MMMTRRKTNRPCHKEVLTMTAPFDFLESSVG
jgi:hypothetical protein